MRTFAQKPKASQQTTRAGSTPAERGHSGRSTGVRLLAHLQRTIGNQAVLRLLRTDAEELKAESTGTASAHAGHDFSRTPIYPPAPAAIQTKLAINKPGDSHEQEADRVAERVMRMPEPGLKPTCACGGACPKCQTSKSEHVYEHLQMRSAAPGGVGFVEAPPVVHEALSSPGQPLEPATRAFMESRFGHDFSRVRVHTDPVAVRSAEAVAAHAYTVGSDVVFGAGRYAPSSRSGQRLLAHELAHVVQQDPARPVLRRFPDCRRLLSTNEAGPRVAEASVQEFLADELEAAGDVLREFSVPGGSAAPLRTEGREGRGGGDTIIDPQLIGESIKGRVDIALWSASGLALEFLEVKRASWTGAQFAEQQVVNYVDRGNESIYQILLSWRRRTRNPDAIITSVRAMPTSRYAPPEGPVVIGNQQVLLAWCRSGVMVFKALEVDNEALLYCGISDKGRTDAFIGRMLGQAEEIVAHALRRRLRELFPGDPVNIRPLLDRVRESLQQRIRWLLSEAIKLVCEMSVEVTLAAVLDRLRRALQQNPSLVDGLLLNLTPQGEGVELHLGEAAARTANVLTIGAILYELLSLAPAFI
jgi:Domain of unknown function (DUF4157)